MNNRCFCGLTGRIVTPDDPDYNISRQEWNRAIQKFPIAIVYCYDKYDVSNAIIWSRLHCTGFRIRNGGHSYEGYSTGNDILVIDINQLNSLSQSHDLLKVGGGVDNRQLYDFLSSQDAPFPGGTCPTVGLSGYALGGGWGLSCRKFGLGCDSLVELELVDADGKLMTANHRCNRELFWACRGGGGGNFGVVVSMTFRLPPKTGNVTLIDFYYPDTDAQKQTDYLSRWQCWLEEADDNMTLVSRIYHSPEEGFAVSCRGLYYGTPEKAQSMLKPLINLGGCRLELEYLTFSQAIERIEAGYPDSEKFQSTGRFVVKPLSPLQISNTVALIRDVPPGSVWNGLSLYALGGKVSEVSPCSTAFFYRNAQYIIGIQSVWREDRWAQPNRNWLAHKFPCLASVTAGSYVNFPYNGLSDYQKAYYGGNASRLRQIKCYYDPQNVFRFPQSITPC